MAESATAEVTVTTPAAGAKVPDTPGTASGERVIRDNVRYRARHHADAAEIERLRALVPKDGQAVVSRADHDELAAYRKFGKPADVEAKLATGEQAAATLADTARAEEYSGAGYKGRAVVSLAKAQGWHVEVKTDKNDKGEDVRTLVARPAADAAAPLEPFDAFAGARLDTDLAAALRVAPATGAHGAGSTTAPRGGVPMIPQTGTPGAPAKAGPTTAERADAARVAVRGAF